MPDVIHAVPVCDDAALDRRRKHRQETSLAQYLITEVELLHTLREYHVLKQRKRNTLNNKFQVSKATTITVLFGEKWTRVGEKGKESE